MTRMRHKCVVSEACSGYTFGENRIAYLDHVEFVCTGDIPRLAPDQRERLVTVSHWTNKIDQGIDPTRQTKDKPPV